MHAAVGDVAWFCADRGGCVLALFARADEGAAVLPAAAAGTGARHAAGPSPAAAATAAEAADATGEAGKASSGVQQREQQQEDVRDGLAGAAAAAAAVAGGDSGEKLEVGARQGSWEGLVALLPAADEDSDDWE